MDQFGFERECRTSSSECFTVLEEESVVGRLDIHFADNVVHATLSVSESLTSERIQELIDLIDRHLLSAVGIVREETIVHVHQGRDLGVFSTPGFQQNGGQEIG